MTQKQINTLILFAMGLPFHKIARRERVSISTVRSRLKAINNTNEYNKACSIRNSNKRLKYNIKNPLQISSIDAVNNIIQVF